MLFNEMTIEDVKDVARSNSRHAGTAQVFLEKIGESW